MSGSGGGGGLRNADIASLTNVTVTGNTTTSAGGGLRAFASLDVHNTIVAANLAGAGSPDCAAFSSSAPVSLGYNLIGDGTGCQFAPMATDIVGSTGASIDPSLGPLQNNGGLTTTHELLAGSPALDAGDDAATLPPLNLTTDQRGSPRLMGSHVDIGAFEFGAVADTTPPVVTPPDELTMEANNSDGLPATDPAISAFLSAATAEDDVDGSVPVSHDAPSTFEMGTTPVTFEATDSAGNTGTAVAMVTITEPTPAWTPQSLIQRLITQISDSDLHRRVKDPPHQEAQESPAEPRPRPKQGGGSGAV